MSSYSGGVPRRQARIEKQIKVACRISKENKSEAFGSGFCSVHPVTGGNARNCQIAIAAEFEVLRLPS
jgi:hypothetical protein